MNMNFKYYDQENIEHDGELIAAVTINGKRYILYETEEIKPEGDVIQFVREKLNQLIDSL